MQNNKGWILMHRDYRETLPPCYAREKYSHPEAFLDLICLANWEPKEWLGIRIERGEFVTSLQALADRWKWGRTSVKRFLKTLEKSKKVCRVVSTPQERNCAQSWTHIRVVNYEQYQTPTQEPNQGVNSTRSGVEPGSVHSGGPLLKQETINNKQEKKIYIDYPSSHPESDQKMPAALPSKPLKDLYGSYVHLSKKEYEKFLLEFDESFVKAAIQKLDAWIGSNPTPKRKTNGKNAAACFRSWVFNAVSEDMARKARNQPQQTHQEKIINVMREVIEEERGKHEIGTDDDDSGEIFDLFSGLSAFKGNHKKLV